jgi:O-antigen ligase
MLGRRPDLTDRMPVWEELLATVKDPILGVGYEVFWAGERMEQLWKILDARIITAHNGYLDIYLSIGIVGLFLMLMNIIAGATKAIKHLNHEYAYAMLRISLIIVVVLENWTESTFKPVTNMFVLFLVAILEVPHVKSDQKQPQI